MHKFEYIFTLCREYYKDVRLSFVAGDLTVVTVGDDHEELSGVIIKLFNWLTILNTALRLTYSNQKPVRVAGRGAAQPDASLWRKGQPVVILEVDRSRETTEAKQKTYHMAGVEELWLYNQRGSLILMAWENSDLMWRPMEPSETSVLGRTVAELTTAVENCWDAELTQYDSDLLRL